MKKFLSIILAILMIVTTVPMAFAAEGDTRTIYVDWNFGWHAGNFQKMFFDSMGNELPYEFESIEDNFDLYRISVDAASYWFDFSNNGIHEGAIPEKVDYYEAATKTWSCSHQMGTSGEQTCKGYLCEICDEFYGEADTDAHDWSNCGGSCVICNIECGHETYTNEVCDICGWICDHSSVDVSEKNCDYCGKDIDSAEITVGETVQVNNVTVYEFTPEYSGTYIVSSATATSDEYIDPSVELYKGDAYTEGYDDCYDENGEIADYNFTFAYNYEAGQTYYLIVHDLATMYGFTVTVECETHNWSESECLACGYECDHAAQTGSACEICGATLHTCDFSGEWKYDSENHWKECECGLTGEEGSHSFTDGKCECDKISYDFIHQPTAEEPYVELEYNEGTSYQWYKTTSNEITDDKYAFPESEYVEGKGWISTVPGYFMIDLKAGDTIDFEFSEICGAFALALNGDLYDFLQPNSKECTVTVDVDGTYYAILLQGSGYIRSYLRDSEPIAVDGENESILKTSEIGTYMCEVTFADGTKVKSDSFELIHTCDFTGEWKHDSEKHWKECTCGEIDEEAVHTLTEGKCDCGYECPHEETYETVTKLEHFSVQNPDGTWTKAVISVACKNCYEILEEKEADRADYTEFDEILEKICEYLDSGKLIDNAYNGYISTINNIKNNPYIIGSPFQSTPDGYIEELNRMLSEIEAGIADGSMIKADFTYMTSLFDEINALIDSDPNKLTPDAGGMYRGIYNGYYVPQSKNNNHSQESYNLNGKYYETQLENLLAAIKDGSKLKADYTAIDEAIAEIDEKLADKNLTDEAKAGLEEIKTELEEMKKNPLSSKVDVEELMDAVEELDEAIKDGTIVLVDVYKILEEYDIARTADLEEKYGREKVDEVFLKIHRKNPGVTDSIYEYADSITGTVAETADEIEELKARVDALYAAIERCIIGTHNVEEYEVVSPAKCGTNAIESGTCTFCCDVITREVENSALKHSFTKYEETEAPKCGVAGKEVAYCDNGCGEIEVRATEALKHIPLDAVKENEVDPECEKEGSYDLVVYCDLCGGEISRETFAVDALEHLFIDYIYNEDATCTADGTKTAECIYGCGETDTVTAEDTMLDHADEDGDKICDDCETEIKDVCPDCGGAVHEGQIAEYICMLVTLIKLIVALVQVLGIIA